MDERKRIVRDGYDKIARAYLEARDVAGADIPLLADLIARLPRDARVLDAGCGAGVPVTRLLGEVARVIAVDISQAQLRLARQHVPSAALVCADIAAPGFQDASFDAICSYYAVIHVPRDEHPALLRNFHRILKPHGYVLLTMGRGETAGSVESDWFGAPMYWSHYDSATNVRLLGECGFAVLWSKDVSDNLDAGAAHTFLLAQKED